MHNFFLHVGFPKGNICIIDNKLVYTANHDLYSLYRMGSKLKDIFKVIFYHPRNLFPTPNLHTVLINKFWYSVFPFSIWSQIVKISNVSIILLRIILSRSQGNWLEGRCSLLRHRTNKIEAETCWFRIHIKRMPKPINLIFN